MLSDYDFRVPSTLDEALRLRAEGWRPFAGGTDLMVSLNAGHLAAGRYFSIWHLRELRGIDVRDGAVVVGALTTYADILRHPVMQTEFPNLVGAARETGAEAIQNRGTLGGNIANASPAADSPPALLSYEAELELVSVSGRRRVAYDGFHTGYKEMEMRSDEIVAAVHLPRVSVARVHYYRKVGTRRAQAISKVVMACAAVRENGSHQSSCASGVRRLTIALGSVAPTVVRCHCAEAVLREAPWTEETLARARDALRNDIAPIDDIRSTARYRLRVSENLLDEFVRVSGMAD